MTMPSEQRYRDLIEGLRAANRALTSADDEKARLAIGVKTLQGVIRYLHGDVEVLDGQLTRPLAIVENAIFDAGQGATVALLEHQPPRTGKPKGTVREYVQGDIAIAVDLLMAAKFGRDDAIKWVAAEARRLNV